MVGSTSNAIVDSRPGASACWRHTHDHIAIEERPLVPRGSGQFPGHSHERSREVIARWVAIRLLLGYLGAGFGAFAVSLVLPA